MTDVSVDSQEAELSSAEPQPDDDYRAVSLLALASLAAGLASPLAILDPFLYSVPALGIALSVMALTRIAGSAGELVGTRAAVVGLLMSLLFGIIPVSASLVEQMLLRARATHVADVWFQQLAAGAPLAAWQLTQPLSVRSPAPVELAEYYEQHPERVSDLEAFLGRPLIKTLLALGERGRARFYRTYALGGDDTGRMQVVQIFAVTYDGPDQERTSFFVRLVLDRYPSGADGGPHWRVGSAEGGVKPPGWEDRHAPRRRRVSTTPTGRRPRPSQSTNAP